MQFNKLGYRQNNNRSNQLFSCKVDRELISNPACFNKGFRCIMERRIMYRYSYVYWCYSIITLLFITVQVFKTELWDSARSEAYYYINNNILISVSPRYGILVPSTIVVIHKIFTLQKHNNTLQFKSVF